MPTWKRLLAVLVCAIVSAWVLEYFLTSASLEHYIVVFLLREIGTDVGSWMACATIRAVLYTVVAVGAFAYLSPERFKDNP